MTNIEHQEYENFDSFRKELNTLAIEIKDFDKKIKTIEANKATVDAILKQTEKILQKESELYNSSEYRNQLNAVVKKLTEYSNKMNNDINGIITINKYGKVDNKKVNKCIEESNNYADEAKNIENNLKDIEREINNLKRDQDLDDRISKLENDLAKGIGFEDEVSDDVENDEDLDNEEQSREKFENNEKIENKERERDKNGYVISEGIRPNASNLRFGKNGSSTNAKVIMNGPLYGNNGPEGGYIENGIVKNTNFRKDNSSRKGNFGWNNGIFGCDTNGKMHMFSYKEIVNQNGSTITRKIGDKTETITFNRAFQNGPMLVKDGEQQVTSSSHSKDPVARTAIGVTSTGEIKGIQVNRAYMDDLATFCKNQGFVNVMYLDGSANIAGMQNGTTKKQYGKTATGQIGIQFG